MGPNTQGRGCRKGARGWGKKAGVREMGQQGWSKGGNGVESIFQ